MLAVTAAMSAARGMTTAIEVFEMPRGYFETFGARETDGIADGLGESWGIVDDLAIKLMPGAWINHALTEAAWTCAIEGDIKPEQVERITTQGRKSARHLLYHPTDLTGVAHSLPYMIAAAIADRTYSWQHVAPEKYMDPVIGALQDKVVGADEASPYASRGGGTLTITLKDGRSLLPYFKAPPGSGPRGIERADIEAKYRALTLQGGMSEQNTEKSLAVIHRLEEAASVSSLVELLRV